MSEELLQIAPYELGRYLYYKLGATTLRQLKKAKIINKLNPKLADKKPDGLIVIPSGTVKAVIEYKTPSELSSENKIKKAIAQELEVARSLCKLLIVTDGSKSFWINALNGEEITQNKETVDLVFNAGKIVYGKMSEDKIIEFENLIDSIEYSISKTNNELEEPKVLDPTPLAKEVWQKIWISTGKEPEKCLYNVVEIFVFKFLSDISVLNFSNNFNSVYKIKEELGNEQALTQYANISRKDIRRMFPEGEDGTTIFNGTIFVNENGEANLSQANLFGTVLDSFQRYEDENGSFKYVTKDFKTRLYETFLRQSAGVKNLGQYFTPRNVVQAMVKMSLADQLPNNARICDPFCGVGGFVLETILQTPNIYKQYEPKNGMVSPEITILGFDKGTDEKDDERTIILAKANMLIYFSELLARYHSEEYLKSFSNNAFNQVFHLIKTNLGTFGKIDEEKFDLILTNPPYVTSGSRTIKESIAESSNKKLREYYQYNGRGTEALAIEWIIKNLKPGGQALVIVPDGLLLQKKVLKEIKKDCIIRAIVSLPTRTFYSTPKKTYILVLEKKFDNEIQSTPVFTYLISEIGETRDAKRFTIEENDLIEMTTIYNQFKSFGYQSNDYLIPSERLKIIGWNDFSELLHWQIDKLWSHDELVKLGIEEEISVLTLEEFKSIVEEIGQDIFDFNKELEGLVNGNN